MRYRFDPPSYQRRPLRARAAMVALLGGFVVVSLIVLLAGRLPFTPTPSPIQGRTYREYVRQDRELLSGYGYTTEGRVHIPIERAIELVVSESRIPVRENPSAFPGN